MMFGWDETFNYFECESCKCLQLADPIQDMSKYYPSDYYSFDSQTNKQKGGVSGALMRIRDAYAVFDVGFVGQMLYKRKPSPNLRLLSNLKMSTDDRILDVGCGDGKHLRHLSGLGFKTLLGADPFIQSEITFGNGHKIVKKTIEEIEGEWDLIMFHHAFEHMPNPKETLEAVERLLAPNGVCLIRIPTASSYAWEHYREHWVQLDAPRHYFLHTQESMAHLAKETGLRVDDCIYDSNAFQFWGSEQYLKGITLMDKQSHSLNPEGSIFSAEQIKSFERKAIELNDKNQGDACAFFLKKSSD